MQYTYDQLRQLHKSKTTPQLPKRSDVLRTTTSILHTFIINVHVQKKDYTVQSVAKPPRRHEIEFKPCPMKTYEQSPARKKHARQSARQRHAEQDNTSSSKSALRPSPSYDILHTGTMSFVSESTSIFKNLRKQVKIRADPIYEDDTSKLQLEEKNKENQEVLRPHERSG
ncbi:hypothetical protein BJ508DRAFT_312721 [Ascobolus immersus RN42]|uniref:Uncharacterized protein n=1 Tax=Ascobolus immersus RN42 TaxID=1160509 RepID=A0A3N4HS55_ASCIM|nr:hypothetical protein BJ508DRAFT_312721 [Ascobolus immersus RN42]